MLGALAMVSLRSWQQHKLRLALTLLGIALGVGAFFSVRTANLTLVDSLQSTVENLAGKATLQISAGEAGFSEDILKLVRNTAGVNLTEPVIEMIAKTGNNENILILGLDTASDLELHSTVVSSENVSISNPLAFINRSDSIAVTQSFANRNGLKEGDPLELYVQEGKKKFTIRGFFTPAGGAEIFGGNLAILDVYIAQEIFGRGKVFDRIDIMTKPDASVKQVKEALQEKLPAGVTVLRPSSRSQGLEKSISSVSLGMTLMSFLALTIGIFIIFNSFYISVTQRWKEIGVLRALGVNSRQTQAMFLGEALVLGFLGSALGIILGYFLAIGATKVMSVVAASSYGLVTTTQLPKIRIDYVAASFVIGMIVSLIAAWIPAREASRLDPIAALRNIETRKNESIVGYPRVIIGLMLLALGLGLTWFASPSVGLVIQLSYWIFIMLGMILFLPKLISIGAFILRPAMNRLFGIEGVIAVDTMSRSPRRTSATVGALMIGLAFVFANGTLIKSQKAALLRTLDRAVNADYFITTSDQIRSRVYHFSEATATRVAGVEGVSKAENLRVTSVDFKGDAVALLAHDMNGWITRSPDVLDVGNAETVKIKMTRGEGFFVSENFAFRFKLTVGDTVTLESPSGSLSRKILGILEYYQSENGTIFMERELYKEYWNDESLDYILITLKPDANREEFKSGVERAISGEQKAFIYSQEEYRTWVTGLIDQFFMLNYLQMVIAIFIAGVGLINTMIISVAERRREIGVLRAVGGLRGQIRKMILLESVCISIIGIFAGLVAGLFNAYCTIKISVVVIAGFSLPFRFPYNLVLLSVPVVIFVALISAWFPATQASNIEIADALDYE